MNQIPNPVRPYPSLPPLGRCPCASCRRRRQIGIESAAEMACAAAAALADYCAALADQSGGPVASAIRAWAGVVRLPVEVARAAQRVRERHKTAAELWAEMHWPVVVIDRSAPVLLPGERIIRRQGLSRFGKPEEDR
jgi:hypothetical protein